MEEKTDSTKTPSTSLWPFIFGGILVTALWAGSIILTLYFFDKTYLEDAAWFGDSFGGINSLFSGLAFAGIIYTILLQRKELQLQRQDLKETRQELKRSADAQEKSESAFTKQIDIMNKTALISGLSSILKYLEAQKSESKNPEIREMYNKQSNEIVERLIELINPIIAESGLSETEAIINDPEQTL